MELGLKVVTACLAAGASLVAFSRSLVFGSARAAQTYIDLKSDPLRPVIQIFENLVTAINRPVAVFVDDLDRCESKYVVELLEGIQTLFREAPITYVVAADRKWICSSFEKEYEAVGKTIGEPGRPLGYLFLDKMFQISVSVPRLLPGPESIALWTIIELRWPLLADFLAARPQSVAVLASGKVLTHVRSTDDVEKPHGLEELYDDEEVKRVLGYGSTGAMALDEQSIRQIVGTL